MTISNSFWHGYDEKKGVNFDMVDKDDGRLRDQEGERSTGFYPFMKVSLDGEHGVVLNHHLTHNQLFNKWEANDSIEYGIIRWDSPNDADFEDWRGLWGVFVTEGGRDVGKDYKFQFINDDGSLKSR